MNDLRDRIAEALYTAPAEPTEAAERVARRTAERDASAVIEALHPTVTDGRLIADLYEETIRFWFNECFPNVTAPRLLVDGIRGQLGGFITEELIGRERRIEQLASDLQHAERENRRLRTDLERTIREAARHQDDDSRALGMMDAADLIRDVRTSHE